MYPKSVSVKTPSLETFSSIFLCDWTSDQGPPSFKTTFYVGLSIRHTYPWNLHGVLCGCPYTHGFNFIVNAPHCMLWMYPCPYLLYRRVEILWVGQTHSVQCVRKLFCLFKKYGWPHTHEVSQVSFPLWWCGCAPTQDMGHIWFLL